MIYKGAHVQGKDIYMSRRENTVSTFDFANTILGQFETAENVTVLEYYLAFICRHSLKTAENVTVTISLQSLQVQD